jgi:adenine-specific DNA-methyltransferase
MATVISPRRQGRPLFLGLEPEHLVRLLDAGEALDVLASARAMARAWSAEQSKDSRLAAARALVATAVRAYWMAETENVPHAPKAPEAPDGARLKLDAAAVAVAEAAGRAAASLESLRAGYELGCLYTATIPDDLRGQLGVYYTPPALTSRLLDMAEEAGIDWRTARVLDPACGGGAFLAPVALRIRDTESSADANQLLISIERRVRGFEIDPFAAWLSQVLTKAVLIHSVSAAGRRLAPLVEVRDSLGAESTGDQFDLVIGNPPYGRVGLSPERRERFARSLYGHANLYQVFTDLALRLARPGGVVAFVTPTSFLAGQYHKHLRQLLAEQAPPVALDFVSARRGIFDDVLQETLLATYRRESKRSDAVVHFLAADGPDRARRIAAGRFGLPPSPAAPWIVPRAPDDQDLAARMRQMQHRLADYGWRVSTGPLVWNRHKRQLHFDRASGRVPIVWAEAVAPYGRFMWRSQRGTHRPWFEPVLPRDEWLMVRRPCVLVQRTTAKEQRRRLIAAELPADFLSRLGGAVTVENHLNMVRPAEPIPAVSSCVLAAILNSSVIDRAFRCISGSVAVSAFELESLPLPSPDCLHEVCVAVEHDAAQPKVDRLVEDLYLSEV